MAIYGDNIIKGRVNDIFCDTASDKTDLPTFAEEHDLKPGSTCLVKQTSDVLMMGSDGSWDAI